MSRLKIKPPKKWRRELDVGFAALRKETAGGGAFDLCVVPADRIDGLIKAGNRGDFHARRIIYSIAEWYKMAQQVAADNEWPHCTCCSVELRHGDVCGFVVFLVPEGEERTGMVGVFCEDCLHLGQQKIADMTIEHMRKHGEVMSTH